MPNLVKSSLIAQCCTYLDVKPHKVVLPVAYQLVLHGRVALAERLQLVEEVCHHLRGRMSVLCI